MRKLIHSVLGTAAALALVTGAAACSKSRNANAPSSVQTPAPAAERVNPGSGYFGNAPENVNRESPPTGMGGGPTSGTSNDSEMGIDQSGGSMGTDMGSGTSGTGSTGTGSDMTGHDGSMGGTGGGPGDEGGMMGPGDAGVPKSKPKSKSGNGSTGDMGGSDKGSGSTGGTMKSSRQPRAPATGHSM
jgi:hypothetical protein